MFFGDKLKELGALLDETSNKIKEMEKEMRAIPLDIRIPFPEISEDAFLGWDSGKKRIIFQEESSKPLLECKSEIRLQSWNALERLKAEVEKIIDEFIKRIEEERRK